MLRKKIHYRRRSQRRLSLRKTPAEKQRAHSEFPTIETTQGSVPLCGPITRKTSLTFSLGSFAAQCTVGPLLAHQSASTPVFLPCWRGVEMLLTMRGV